jgi:hypothetical protein
VVHAASLTGSGSCSGSWLAVGWLRVLVALAAMRAAATRKTLQAVSAIWKPEVSAAGWEAPAASRWWVRPVAIAHRASGNWAGGQARRAGTAAGSSNGGSTLASKRVIALIRSPAKVNTSSPAGRAMPACGSGW